MGEWAEVNARKLLEDVTWGRGCRRACGLSGALSGGEGRAQSSGWCRGC